MIERLLRQNAEADKRLQDIEMQDVVPVVARYHKSAAQSIPNNVATIVDFDEVDFDPWAAVTVGASWKFTAPVAGYYQVDGHVTMVVTANWADGEGLELDVYINGTRFTILGFRTNYPTNTNAEVVGGTVVHLNKGDYIDLQVLQGSGAALNVINATTYHVWVSIHRIKG